MVASALNGKQALADYLITLFRGRADYVARGTARGTFEPAKLPGPMKPEWLARHLAQEQCLGFYLMTPGDRVWCTTVDFDNKPDRPDPEWRDKAEKLTLWLRQAGLSPLVEVSQSGEAAHVWLFFEESADAWLVRAFWRIAANRASVPLAEVYPKQDHLTGKGLGNLVRYPLWNRSRFVEVEDGWAEVDAEAAFSGVARCPPSELRELVSRFVEKLEPPPPPRQLPLEEATAEAGLPARVKAQLERSPHSLLARRWSGDSEGMKDRTDSALTLSIACELVRQYVPTPEVTAALRYWCEENGYAKGAEERALARCVTAAYEYVHRRADERVAGTVEIHDAAHAFIDTLRHQRLTHVPSGIPELDASVEGVGFGEMCVLAARPGHGKSALALQWLESATGAGLPCLLLSAEMSRLQLGKRFTLFVSNLGQEHWGPETAGLLDTDIRRHKGTRAPLYVDDDCSALPDVEAAIDEWSGRGVRVVAVDYLQLLGTRGQQKRYEQVSDVSLRLKQAAKRNGVALLAVSQLNRDLEKRPGCEPKLCDLRDSGQVEQDADLILFVTWPHKFDPLRPEEEYTIYAAKRRNGPIHRQRIDTTFTASRQRVGPFPVVTREPGDDHP